MFCTRCSQPVAAGMVFCPGCGSRVEGLPQPTPDAAGPPQQPPQGYAQQPAVPPPQPGQPYYPPGYGPPPGFGPPPGYGPPPGFGPPPGYAPYAAAPQWAPYPMVKYAGFWRRFAAALIDGLAFGACFWIVAFILMLIAGVGTGGFAAIEPGSGPPVGMIVPIVLLVYVVGPAGFWLYSALMESSARQATLGKMALGIKVTDLNGNRISFGRATGRHFAKFISAIILYIGFMMAGWTERKQALHDMIAGCLVTARQF